MSSLKFNPIIPKGSMILVTGATGFIGSHTADQFLHYGYKVRGTTRDAAKGAWLSDLFAKKYQPDAFELVGVPDMGIPDAYSEAMKGVSAVVHLAAYVPGVSTNTDIEACFDEAVAGVLNVMNSALHAPGGTVRRFVLTSSSLAAVRTKPDTPGTVTVDSWNDEDVELARSPGAADNPRHEINVYTASKVLAEKAAWQYMREKSPPFEFNTVLPSMNFGPSLALAHRGQHMSAAALTSLFQGEIGILSLTPPRKCFLPLVEHYLRLIVG
jgi:nucleoside-diphosphate-sugar epimerase